MTPDDVIAALAARGYKVDARRRRFYTTAAICHPASGDNAPSGQIQKGHTRWSAYCFACERKISKEVLMAIGQSAGGYAPARQAFDARQHSAAGAAAMMADAYRAAEVCEQCGHNGELRTGYKGARVCADAMPCIHRAGAFTNLKARAM